MTFVPDPSDDTCQHKIEEAVRGPIPDATAALLAAALESEDRGWIESVLLTQLLPGVDVQLSGLALTCAGHVARRFGAVCSELVSLVQQARSKAELSGRAVLKT